MPTPLTTRTLAVLLLGALAACHDSAAPPLENSSAITPGEMAASADDPDSWAAASAPEQPATMPTGAGTPYAEEFEKIAQRVEARKKKATVRYKNGELVSDDSLPIIKVTSEFDGFRNGKIAVPAYPGDLLYLGLTLETVAGTVLKQKPVEIRSAKQTAVVLMRDRTNDEGYLEFHMVAGAPGSDLVTVTAAGVHTDFYIDVTDPPRNEWMNDLDLKGVTSWDLLLSANVKVGLTQVSAQFPGPLQSLDKRKLKLAGFMLPLGMEEKQKHFLLTANPPSCFFHPPGGAASVVEVFADKGVAMSFDPVIIEGELELIPVSDSGMLYKLKSGKLIAGGG